MLNNKYLNVKCLQKVKLFFTDLLPLLSLFGARDQSLLVISISGITVCTRGWKVSVLDMRRLFKGLVMAKIQTTREMFEII